MFSKIMFCRNKLSSLKIWVPLIISVSIWVGCGGDEPLDQPTQHTLEINGLSITNQTLNAGSTATVTALATYSGDEVDLIYTWKASGGKVIGNTPSVTYLAPDAPGKYTITLELTDGFVADQHSITVEVVAQSLKIDSNTYWEGKDLTLVLKYQVNITGLLRPNVTLRYEILQDRARTGAFLSLHINGVPVVEEAAIGEVQPLEKPAIMGEVDVSKVIKAPGRYELTLTLVVAQAVDQGWLLRSAELVGAEGSATQL